VIRSAAAVLTLALAAAGCGAKPGNTTHPADSPAESVASTGKSVGIAFPSDETERWKTEGEWLAKRFTSRGYEAKLIYSGGQADRQAKDLASLISGGVSLLIVAPVDAEKLSDPLAAAREAGIPVLSYGSVIRNSDAVTCAVLPDSRQMGVRQAQSVISALGVSKDENAKVSRIELAAGPAEDPQTALLYDGIYATLEPYLSAGSLKIPSGEVRLADVSAGSQEKAESRMEQILKSDYGKDTELAAVLGGTLAVTSAAAAFAGETEASTESSTEATADFTGSGKVAYVCTGLGDMSFNDSGEVGMNVLRAAGYDVNTIETGEDASTYDQLIQNAPPPIRTMSRRSRISIRIPSSSSSISTPIPRLRRTICFTSTSSRMSPPIWAESLQPASPRRVRSVLSAVSRTRSSRISSPDTSMARRRRTRISRSRPHGSATGPTPQR